MPENCNPNECPLSLRVEALERANEQHSDTHKEMFDRLRALEKENAVQNANYKAIEAKLDELTVMVKNLTEKPAKRWDSFGDKILWFLVEAVLIVAAVKIGLM